MALESLSLALNDPLTLVSLLGMFVMLALGIWRALEHGPDEVERLLARAENRPPRAPERSVRRDAILGSLGSLGLGAVFLAILPSSPRPGIVTYPVATYLLGMMVPTLMGWALECAVWLRFSSNGSRSTRQQQEE